MSLARYYSLPLYYSVKCFYFRKLICSRCELTKTLSSLKDNGKLDSIEMDHNLLTSQSLSSLPSSLTLLNLSFNLLTDIPLTVLALHLLLSLNVSSNKLTSLAGLESLTSLIDLNADDNLIAEIPSEVATILTLRHISLQRNSISSRALSFEGQSIHESVFRSSNIEAINLSGNPVTKAELIRFEGVESFLERRKRAKDKNLLTGAATDLELFGLS